MSEDEALLSKLFQYRFSDGRGLKGHSFGNLFLTALTHLTGDFAQAVKVSSEVLASLGPHLPVHRRQRDAGSRAGERSAWSPAKPRSARAARPFAGSAFARASASRSPETLEAIAQADLITLGPGSLFTSVIPNLLVEGIPQAIAAAGR